MALEMPWQRPVAVPNVERGLSTFREEERAVSRMDGNSYGAGVGWAV